MKYIFGFAFVVAIFLAIMSVQHRETQRWTNAFFEAAKPGAVLADLLDHDPHWTTLSFNGDRCGLLVREKAGTLEYRPHDHSAAAPGVTKVSSLIAEKPVLKTCTDITLFFSCDTCVLRSVINLIVDPSGKIVSSTGPRHKS